MWPDTGVHSIAELRQSYCNLGPEGRAAPSGASTRSGIHDQLTLRLCQGSPELYANLLKRPVSIHLDTA
jgi:hypothetical protein